MEKFRQFNDRLNGQSKPINTRPKLLQWISRYKFTNVDVIHQNDINEDPNGVLRQVAIQLRKSNGKLTIILIEE